MEMVATLPRQPWPLGKLYKTTAAIIILLIICAPAFYNSDLLLLLALALQAALLVLGAFASCLFTKNLSWKQGRCSLAWLLLACLNFTGWWANNRIGTVALQSSLSPDDPALGDLLHRAFAPYFSS
jgi:hypothetical protein